MGKPVYNNEMVRKRISISIPEDQVDWIDEKVKDRVYANRSFVIEIALRDFIERLEKKA